MNAPFALGANLAHVLARFRIEEIANDYLAKFASKDAPRPDVRGTNAETVARLALTDLEMLSYATRTFVIPALAVGAKHKRERTWVVANCKSNQSNVRKNDEYSEKREVQKTAGGGRSIPPNTHGVRLQRPWGAFQPLHHTSKTNRQEHRVVDDSGWPVEPDMGRVANGVPNGVDRLKALGNAVVPQIPELIGHAILEAEAAA